MTTASPDLVLQARLELLRSSLGTVEGALADLEAHRRSEPGQPELVAATKHILDALRNLGSRGDQVEAAFNGDPTGQREVTEWLSGLKRLVSEADEALRRPSGPRLTLNDTTVDENLREDVGTQRDKLDALEKRVVAAANDTVNGDTILRDVWVDYRESETECQKLFDEYLDLVRGVLLRDAGLDNELCRIADALVRLWGQFKDYRWQSLTIPASRERRDVSSARLIRIGFPEWTIWSLPLTGCEFGHVFAARHDAMQGLAKTLEQPPTGLHTEVTRSWIADAFATGVMGPAFAWAVLLLRTDPRKPRDCERLAVILAMLETLATDELSTYRLHVERFREEWQRSRQRQPDAPPAENPDHASAVADVVDAVTRRLRAPFNDSHWQQAETLAEALESGDEAPAVAAGLEVASLPHVLVGGWIARVRLIDETANPDPLRPSFTTRMSDLTELVRATCAALVDGTSLGSPGGSTGGPLGTPYRTATGMPVKPPRGRAEGQP